MAALMVAERVDYLGGMMADSLVVLTVESWVDRLVATLVVHWAAQLAVLMVDYSAGRSAGLKVDSWADWMAV